MLSGRLLSHCCRRSQRSRKAVARGSPTVPRLAASSSSCALVAPGDCSRRRWAVVAASPAGDDCGTGKRSGCGSDCMRRCSTGWVTKPPLTGAGRASIPSASEQKGGRADRPQPDRSGEAWLQVPPRGGSNGYSAGGAPLGRERSRRDSAHPIARRHSIHHRPSRTTGPAPEAPGQAPC